KTFGKKGDNDLDDVELVIIDEASMVTNKIKNDLLSKGIKILLVGDTAQLPPIDMKRKPTDARDILGEPDFNLIDVHRQGEDSAIIELSELVKNKQSLPYGSLGSNQEVKVVSLFDFNNDFSYKSNVYLHADQIICGRNDTRHRINQEVRQLKGASGKLPQKGE